MPPEAWYVLAALMILVGLLGTWLPVLPGIPLVFAGMLLAAWVDGFERIGWISLTILAVLTVISIVVDFLASAFGTRLTRASGWAFVGAGVGALVGIFFGLPGLLVGPFVGALLCEWMFTRNLSRATSAGLGTFVGLVLGGIAKIALAFTMLGVFVIALLI